MQSVLLINLTYNFTNIITTYLITLILVLNIYLFFVSEKFNLPSVRKLVSLKGFVLSCKINNIFNMMRLVYFVVLISTVLVILNPNSIQAQSQTNPTNLPSLQKLDEQANLVQIKQLTESELRQKVTDLKKENDRLDSELLELNRQISEQQNNLEVLRRATEDKNLMSDSEATITIPISGTQSSSGTTQNIKSSELETKIKEIKQRVNDLVGLKDQKESQRKANLSFIQESEKVLNQKNVELQQEQTELQKLYLDYGAKIAFYLFVFVVFWIVLRLIYWSANRFVSNEPIRKLIKNTTTILTLTGFLAFIIMIFIGNLSYLLAGLGIFSAAFVVALQDFVSSFFAWIWIRFRNLYRPKDIIMLSGSHSTMSGQVTDIGIFRTSMKELISDNTLNSERPTGRTISFPNNLILKDALTNYTKENKVLWHSLSVIITFESDYALSRKLLEEICDKEFAFHVDHKDIYLDEIFNLKTVCKPKIFMTIASDGPQFTIWFAARYGMYREVLERYYVNILKAFQENGIDLAYQTHRILSK
ncbi:MAG: hypothetical protein OHK0017_09990 [Patescibacteria group bacterium]